MPNKIKPPKVPRPSQPTRYGLESHWKAQHQDLYNGVKTALAALPDGFEPDISISGVDATDLFGLNSALGSAIERHVVETLNDMRSVWDPVSRYPTYSFVRYAQSFPDVRLIDRSGANSQPLMGIELKGWFALAKEKEPSFRFEATPLACAPQDLLVVVPWIFSNVLSGRPRLMTPFIEEARYAAEMRNYHWTWIRGDGGAESQVILSPHKTPYPQKTDASSDKASHDKGGNFGRVARADLLSEFTKTTLDEEAAGIPIKYWVQFLTAFTEQQSNLDKKMENLAKQAKHCCPVK